MGGPAAPTPVGAGMPAPPAMAPAAGLAADDGTMAPAMGMGADPADDGMPVDGVGMGAPVADPLGGWIPDYWPTEAWQVRAPEELDYDPAVLQMAVDFASESATQALLLIQDGYIISENYFRGFDAETRHESFSMAKSFTSALIGIAIDEGLLPGVEAPICQYYDEWDCDDSSDGRRLITIEHAMTLSTGLMWMEEWGEGANLLQNDAIRMSSSPGGPLNYVLSKPSAQEPGTFFQYSTGDPALLSGVLQRATGMSALDYAREKILQPIGAQSVQWNSDPQGRTTTFAGLQATAQDYARYGFLFLNRGAWDGAQRVPAAWVDLSTRPGRALEPWYGYLWHVNLPERFESPGLPADGFTAQGVQGQFITVIPSERLVLVRLAADELAGAEFDIAGLYQRILAAKSP